MTTTVEQHSHSGSRVSLRQRMLQGAGILTALTALNLLIRGHRLEVPLWAALAFFPVVAFCGAVAGATYYATDGLRASGGWRRRVANIATLLSYSLVAFALLLGVLYLLG